MPLLRQQHSLLSSRAGSLPYEGFLDALRKAHEDFFVKPRRPDQSIHQPSLLLPFEKAAQDPLLSEILNFMAQMTWTRSPEACPDRIRNTLKKSDEFGDVFRPVERGRRRFLSVRDGLAEITLESSADNSCSKLLVISRPAAVLSVVKRLPGDLQEILGDFSSQRGGHESPVLRLGSDLREALVNIGAMRVAKDSSLRYQNFGLIEDIREEPLNMAIEAYCSEAMLSRDNCDRLISALRKLQSSK